MKMTMTCMAVAAIAWATGGAEWAGCTNDACNTEAPPEARAVIVCSDSCNNTEAPAVTVAGCNDQDCNTEAPPESPAVIACNGEGSCHTYTPAETDAKAA